VSAAVRDADGLVIGAVSVSGPAERLGRTPGRRLGPAVVLAAERISLAASTGT
jgi:DNA-binding IclR family transcriptional regulator